jgi:lipopolysaccharide/colanic/teichoic acid biosynthesis glycosyltransferase
MSDRRSINIGDYCVSAEVIGVSAGDQVIDIKLTKSTPQAAKINTEEGDSLKRAFDIIVSILVLFFLSPLFLLIAIAIKRGSPGPVFYRGKRIGLNGKPFEIIKFRTMEDNPLSYAGPRVTAHDDWRINGLGRWLRDTKLNEFPQFWNVLKGDMSLVGPRPEDPELAKSWPRDVWNEIVSVRPGITSPASVQYHDEEKLLSNCNVEQMYLMQLSPDKVRLDQLYIRYRSFLLDLDTILWTAITLIPVMGSYKPPEELLFLGFFSRIIRWFFNWFTVDLLITILAFGTTGIIFNSQQILEISAWRTIALTIAYAILFSGLGIFFGTNRIRWTKADPSDIFDLVTSWILATTIAIFANLIWDYFPLDLILLGSVFSLFGFIIVRTRSMIIKHFLERSLIFHKKDQLMRERVLIIGLGVSAQHTAWLFDHLMNSRLFHMVGFVDNDLTKQGIRIFGSNVIGKWGDIPSLVEKYDIGLIILADYRVDSQGYMLIKNLCSSTTARLVVMPDILASINRLVKQQADKVETADIPIYTHDTKCNDCLAQFISGTNSSIGSVK